MDILVWISSPGDRVRWSKTSRLAQDAVSVKQSVLLRKFEQQVEADEGFTSGLTSMMERLKLSE